MAKKKPGKSKQPVPRRKATIRKAARRNPGRKTVNKNPRKGARVVARKRPPVASRPVTPSPVDERPSLGRPRVTGDEDLDLFFKEDYHARQIFKFLGVQTVKELERYSSSEILRRLSIPIKETVERVRRLLAQYNRCLHGDETFALEHKTPALP